MWLWIAGRFLIAVIETLSFSKFRNGAVSLVGTQHSVFGRHSSSLLFSSSKYNLPENIRSTIHRYFSAAGFRSFRCHIRQSHLQGGAVYRQKKNNTQHPLHLPMLMRDDQSTQRCHSELLKGRTVTVDHAFAVWSVARLHSKRNFEIEREWAGKEILNSSFLSLLRLHVALCARPRMQAEGA